MQEKLTDIIARETFGKNCGAGKFTLSDSESQDTEEISQTVFTHSAEPSNTSKYTDLLPISRKLSSSGSQLLTYFLDGSRRVFKAGEISYSRTVYPVIAGQISAGACRRVSRRLVPEILRREIVIAVPDIASPDSNVPGFFPAIARKLSDSPAIKRRGLEISAVITYPSAKDSRNTSYEDKATIAVQERMIQREKEITESLVRKLNHRNYLVKDGSLEYRKKSQLPNANYRWVIGLSKSFSRESCRNYQGKIDQEYIAELPPYHRTRAVIYRNPEIFGDTEFAVWYIRLHERGKSAFAGIVKAEKMLITQSERGKHEIDSAEIDTLSAYILNERNPVCYGNDPRWAGHIYPVYLTEKYIKSRYISAESFLHMF
ncbi:MAG: hypothetical protein II832_03750 [Synergistaceae bacterium]|nr:hypothetical protein [Synergistaceae bacterium]MBQ6972884.1 hypothetical protein [Synergistaceae bacterium]